MSLPGGTAIYAECQKLVIKRYRQQPKRSSWTVPRMVRQSVSGLAIRPCASLDFSAVERKTGATFADRATYWRGIRRSP